MIDAPEAQVRRLEDVAIQLAFSCFFPKASARTNNEISLGMFAPFAQCPMHGLLSFRVILPGLRDVAFKCQNGPIMRAPVHGVISPNFSKYRGLMA
jgi:hypothetical protein